MVWLSNESETKEICKQLKKISCFENSWLLCVDIYDSSWRLVAMDEIILIYQESAGQIYERSVIQSGSELDLDGDEDNNNNDNDNESEIDIDPAGLADLDLEDGNINDDSDSDLDDTIITGADGDARNNPVWTDNLENVGIDEFNEEIIGPYHNLDAETSVLDYFYPHTHSLPPPSSPRRSLLTKAVPLS